MAENNQQTENEMKNLEYEKADHVMANPLLRSLRRYFFVDTPANQIRSIDLGRSVFRFFAPELTIPDDPAALLTATHRLLLSREINDDDLVRFFLDKVIYENQGSALLTPDLMADVLESDAYKNLDQNAKGKAQLDLRNHKQIFETWIREKSMLSKIQQAKPVDVVFYKNDLERVINALGTKSEDKVNYQQQINSMVDTFDELYVNHMHPNALAELQAVAKDSKTDYAERLKAVYNVLCSDSDNISCETIYDTIDKTRAAADAKDRDTVLTAYGLATNKILLAVAERKGWSNQDVQSIILKFPIEERAEKFEEEAARRQTPLTSDAGAMGQAIKKVLQEDEEVEFATVDDFQPAQPKNEVNETGFVSVDAEQQPTQAKNEVMVAPSKELSVIGQPKQFNYALDVAKTFGFTFGGAMALSAISAIPVFGKAAGPLVAVTAIATAGIDQAAMAIKAAKANGKVTKKEAVKIATKTAGAVLAKMAPYAAATVFGMKVRAVGSVVVMGKAFFNDLGRRAGLLNAQLDQEKPKGLKATLNRLAAIANTVSKSDVKKAAGYAAAKGAATFLGGMFGQKAGNKLGTFAGEKFLGGNKTNVAPMENETQKVQPVDESQATENRANTQNTQDNHDKKLSSLNEKMINNSNGNETMAQDVNHHSQLSDYNRQRLGKIGNVELTDNARATAYVENHRQFIGGVQDDWCNAAQEKIAIQTLRDAGVDDPYGVWRKLGSASRFFGGEYKAAWDDLCRGELGDKNINPIFNSLRLINEEGGLGRVINQTYEAPQPTVQPVFNHAPVYEPVPADVNVEWAEGADQYVTHDISHVVEQAPAEINYVQYEEPIDNVEWAKGADQYVNHDVPHATENVSYEEPIDNVKWADGADQYSTHNLEHGTQFEQNDSTPWPGMAGYSENGYLGGEMDSNVQYPTFGADSYAFENDDYAAPATLSNDQLARLRANNTRVILFDEDEAGRYLSSFNADEIDAMSQYWSQEEKSEVIGILENSIKHGNSQPTVDYMRS